MTYDQAIRRATQFSVQFNEQYFVVFDRDTFSVATVKGLDAIYLGAPIVAAVQPDGTVQTAH